MSVEEMRWDLSQLVESTDPASVRQTLESMVAEAEKIRDEYPTERLPDITLKWQDDPAKVWEVREGQTTKG